MRRAGAGTNLAVELGSSCLFLLCVAVCSLIFLFSSTYLGMELTSTVQAETEVEKVVFVPRAFLVTFLLLSIPTLVMGLAIFGMRTLLIEPEPPPWVVQEPDSQDGSHEPG